MKANRILAFSVKVGVTVLLLYLVFRSVDPARIRHDLARLEIGRLIVLILITLLGQLFCTQRWRLFAGALGLRGSFRTFLRMYFSGMLFNIGLPSVVGGDVIKAYMITRKSRSGLHLGIASVLQDRAAGMVSLILYGTVATFLFPMSWRGIPLWAAYLAVWAGTVGVLWLVWRGRRIYSLFLVAGSQTFFMRMMRHLNDLHDALSNMQLSAWAALQVVAYSLLNSALVLWIFQQVSVAAGYPVDFAAFSALFPLIAILTTLPVSLGGVGLREWGYVQGFALVQVPADAALTIALASSAMHVVADLAGVFFLPSLRSELRVQSPS